MMTADWRVIRPPVHFNQHTHNLINSRGQINAEVLMDLQVENTAKTSEKTLRII